MKGKILVGLVVIDRPRTTERCIQSILNCTCREKIEWVVVDNGSNDETKEMLRKYEKEFDHIIWNDWNTGCCFGINRWMSFRRDGQICIDVNADVEVMSRDWLDIMMTILADADMGVVAGRRPEFWIDRSEKFQMLRGGGVFPEQRHGYWCEIIPSGLILGPFWMIKGELIDQIGYMNEADGYDDIDYGYRVVKTELLSCYVPNAIIQQPQDEEQNHPQYGSHKALLARNSSLYRWYLSQYVQGKSLYCGTRFKPGTITDPVYQVRSDGNWEYLKLWEEETCVV